MNEKNGKMVRKLDFKTIKRILSYMKRYKKTLALVFACILLGSIASVSGSIFLGTLIDEYITPLLGDPNPVFTGLLKTLAMMTCICLVGVLSSWLYMRSMATIAQGTLKAIRDEMFEKMQRLPIRYFDTHTHGDIMSRYTNDTDTLRQMINQSLPQLINSGCTIVTVFCSMLYQSIYLTLIVLASVALILQVVRFLTARSGYYFMRQQETLGQLNG